MQKKNKKKEEEENKKNQKITARVKRSWLAHSEAVESKQAKNVWSQVKCSQNCYIHTQTVSVVVGDDEEEEVVGSLTKQRQQQQRFLLYFTKAKKVNKQEQTND